MQSPRARSTDDGRPLRAAPSGDRPEDTTPAPSRWARVAASSWWPTLAVGLMAAAFCGFRYTEPSLWRDEVSTVIAARRSWPSLADMLSRIDLVHGPYFAVVKVWSGVAGTSVGAVRAISVIAVVLTAMAVVRLGRRLFDRWTGYLAGAIMAVLPTSTWSATEARSPGLATLLVVLTVWALVVAIRSERRRAWVVYGVSAAAAVTVFVFAVLPLLAIPALVLGRREARRPWLIATGLAALAVLPFGWSVIRQRSHVAWIQPWKPERWPRVPAEVLSPTQDVPALWIGLLVGLVAGVVVTAVGRSRGDRFSGAERAVLLGVWAVAPTATVIALSVLSPPGFYVPRYLLPCVPAFALATAALLGALRPRVVAVGVVVALLVVSVPVWQAQRQPDYKGPFRQIAEQVAAERQPGDAALFTTISATTGSTRAVAYGYPEAFAGVTDLTVERPFSDNTGVGLWESSGPLAAHRDRLAGAGRVWVIGVGAAPAGDLAELTEQGWRPGPMTRYSGRYTVQLWTRAP